MLIRTATALMLGAACAHAGDVYKCTNADGAIAFQDQPCGTGSTETIVHMAAAPPSRAAAGQGEDGEAMEPGGAAPLTQVHIGNPQQRNFSTSLFSCINGEDGKEYISRNGNPEPRMVPAGTMGIPGQSLAQAYRPGGIGVSAPGMRKIPIDNSPQAAIAGAYVAVQDQCAPASQPQACAYLRKQYDEVQQKLKRAFKDEQAVLKPQAAQLSRELDGC
jgi:Domain of unknown function (DUF4124)